MMRRWRQVGETLLVLAALAVDLLVWGGDRQLRWGGLAPLWVVPALTAVVYLALLWRWRAPLSVFTLLWAFGACGLALPQFQPFAGLLVALYAVARRVPGRVAVGALVSCLVPFGLDSLDAATSSDGRGPDLAQLAASAALWSALSLTVWGLGRMAYTSERRAEALKEAQAAEAVRAERLRLARELHDIVSHTVSAMTLQASGAATLVGRDNRAVRQSLGAIEDAGVQAMGELHRLLGLLRAPGAGEAAVSSRRGLSELEDLVRTARNAGLSVDVVVTGRARRLDDSVDLAAYRLVQEGLTNAVKHAGAGARVQVTLRWGEGSLELAVNSIGRRTSPRPELSSGLGLLGLSERMAAVGGTLRHGPTREGFEVAANLPVQSPASLPLAAGPVAGRREPGVVAR